MSVLAGQNLVNLHLRGTPAWNHWVEQNPNSQVQICQHYDGLNALNNMWDKNHAVDFSNRLFPKGGFVFHDVLFEGAIDFRNAIFLGGNVHLRNLTAGDATSQLSFADAKFYGDIVFNGKIGPAMVFAGAEFKGQVDFVDCEFKRLLQIFHAKFMGLKFHAQQTTFEKFAGFKGAEFSCRSVVFSQCQFKEIVNFNLLNFDQSRVIFERTRFQDIALFDGLKDVENLFELSFQHSAFEKSLILSSEPIDDFKPQKFGCVVDLIGTKFAHQLNLERVTCELKRSPIPQTPRFVKKYLKPLVIFKANNQEDCARLRSLKELAEVERNQQEALEYKVQEMQAARFHFTPNWQLPLEFLCWILSDYRRSVLRPIGCAMLWLFILGPCAYGWLGQGTTLPPYSDRIALSGHHLMPLMPSFRGDNISPTIECLFPDGPNGAYYALSVSLTVHGPLLLYLTGLALRKKFRS